MDELSASLLLARAPGVHGAQLDALLHRHGSYASVASASFAALNASGVSSTLVEWLGAHREDDLSADLEWLEHDGHHFIAWGSPLYPRLLAQIADAPTGLFVRGDPQALSLPQLAVVGSRNPTPVGRENAHEFAAHLARCGLVITSGFALGIDGASHEGALAAGGTTLAVLGTGLDIDYPKQHRALADAIAESGALVSEFPIGTPPLKNHFPRRNRIISGLAVGTLVVEAALQSGSLITARLAGEQGREVFAIPGSIHNPRARGCHHLIRQGAKLVETVADIFAELKGIVSALAPIARNLDGGRNSGEARCELDKDYEILLDALGFEPAGVDSLVARTGFKADEVASMLLILELENRIQSHPGGLYVRASTQRGS